MRLMPKKKYQKIEKNNLNANLTKYNINNILIMNYSLRITKDNFDNKGQINSESNDDFEQKMTESLMLRHLPIGLSASDFCPKIKLLQFKKCYSHIHFEENLTGDR